MTERSPVVSATILQFPRDKVATAPRREAESGIAVAERQPLEHTDFGSAWYHEEAVQNSRGSRPAAVLP
jgi:hypothetical protein